MGKENSSPFWGISLGESIFLTPLLQALGTGAPNRFAELAFLPCLSPWGPALELAGESGIGEFAKIAIEIYCRQ